MKKYVILFLILTTGLYNIYSIDGFIFEDPALQKLLNAQESNSLAWASNEAYREAGQLQLGISRAMLYPQVNADVDAAASNTLVSENNYTISITPSLKLSQLLPTSGVLTGSVSDTVSGYGLDESNLELLPAGNIEFDNRLSFSLGISQPLYFGNAYEAAKTQISETHKINQITYFDNRNNLIATAVNDYYALIQAAYQKDLVEARLKTNTEYEKRMLRENSLGMWTRGDLNSAKAARLQSEADLIKAIQSYSAAFEKIKTLYGVELQIDTEYTRIELLPFDIENIDPFQILSSGNPEQLITEKQILIADSDIILEKKNTAANLSLGSSYSLTNGITNESNSNNLSFSLGFSLTAIDGGSGRKSIELKENHAIRMKKDFDEKQKIIFSQLQSLLNNRIVGEKLSEIYVLQEETALFDYEKGMRELELGRITQKELLELQISLEKARLSILLNKIDYNLTVLQIYRLLGFNFNLLKESQEGA